MENENWQENNGEKRPRQRFTRVERAYSSDGTTNERAFRPQGFETRTQPDHQTTGYRQGGYQNRQGGYNQGGYNRQGGYQPNRQGGYQNRQGGYQPNRQGEQGEQGGYQPNRQGGYQQNRQGGYQPNRQGGYQNRQGGYQNRQGGYQPNRQGGYKQNRQGGMFRQRTSDYNPNAKYSLKKQIEYKEYLDDPNAPIRLNKFLANAGVCSRREADEFIQAGVIKVNGEIVTELGTKVQRTDQVHFHDQLITLEKKVYVLLNKPKDYVTTSDDPQARKTVMDLVKNCCRERIYPVGRLDRNTTGVLLFTNDGELASKLTHPKYMKKKIYHVHLDRNCTAADLQKIADGVMLDDGPIHADAVSFASETDKKQVGIEIHSGKNRIVRRIFEALGYRVVKLDRVVFAGLTKKGLKRGDWRFLTEQEVAMLHMNTQD
ncbi:MAG: RNA-binding S4 domain-containing protein [Bacteroidaceae bacterium]|nr:RNA-binding S4 domain-containing protein [Bacteroidaceae bacterium]MBQ9176685.1 RNA-binding S4 domain-containing protein [Bacteroidaceae bacterium]MBR1377899.1 RNA-binding S4 domain-containing protein [Bacteroidaceae bacterium]